MTHTQVLPNLSRSLKTPGLSITSLTLSACIISKRRMIEPSLAAFIGLPFAFVFTCTFTECVKYLHFEVHELRDGYIQEFWKTSEYSLKYVLELVASNSHAKVPSKAPHSTGLSQTSSKTQIFSRIITVDRIKPLIARSTNGIVI